MRNAVGAIEVFDLAKDYGMDSTGIRADGKKHGREQNRKSSETGELVH